MFQEARAEEGMRTRNASHSSLLSADHLLYALTTATNMTYHLNHPYQGLLINTGVWRTLEDFSSGAVCLALASELFDENDYIREYDDFIRYVEDKEEGKGPDCEG